MPINRCFFLKFQILPPAVQIHFPQPWSRFHSTSVMNLNRSHLDWLNCLTASGLSHLTIRFFWWHWRWLLACGIYPIYPIHGWSLWTSPQRFSVSQSHFRIPDTALLNLEWLHLEASRNVSFRTSSTWLPLLVLRLSSDALFPYTGDNQSYSFWHSQGAVRHSTSGSTLDLTIASVSTEILGYWELHHFNSMGEVEL